MTVKSLPSSFGRHFLTNSLGNLVTPVATLLGAPILARALGVDGRGEFAAATAPYVLVTTIATVGLPEALTYFVAKNPALLRSALRRSYPILAFVGLISIIGVLVASPWLAKNDGQFAVVIAISTIGVIPALAVAAVRGSAAGLHEWKRVTAERTISAGSRLLGFVILAVIGSLTPFTATIVMVVAPALGGVAYIGMVNHPERRPSVSVRSRTLLAYGSRVWLGSVAGLLLARLDQVLMTPLAGSYQLGLYAVAVNISEVPLILSAAMTSVVFTADAKEPNDARVGTAARVAGLLSLLAALVVGIPMPLWLPFVFGTDFSSAIPVAWLLLLAVVLGPPGSVAGAALSARGSPGLRSTSLFIAAILNTVLLVMLTPALGAFGAALATLAGNVSASYANILFLRVRHGVSLWEFVGVRRNDILVVWGYGRRVLRRRKQKA